MITRELIANFSRERERERERANVSENGQEKGKKHRQNKRIEHDLSVTKCKLITQSCVLIHLLATFHISPSPDSNTPNSLSLSLSYTTQM